MTNEELERYAKERDQDARAMTRLCESYREERDALLLQIDELRGLAHSLDLFVGVYNGKVLDKDAAMHLIRKYAKRSEAVGNEIIEYQDRRAVAERLIDEVRTAGVELAKVLTKERDEARLRVAELEKLTR